MRRMTMVAAVVAMGAVAACGGRMGKQMFAA